MIRRPSYAAFHGIYTRWPIVVKCACRATSSRVFSPRVKPVHLHWVFVKSWSSCRALSRHMRIGDRRRSRAVVAARVAASTSGSCLPFRCGCPCPCACTCPPAQHPIRPEAMLTPLAKVRPVPGQKLAHATAAGRDPPSALARIPRGSDPLVVRHVPALQPDRVCAGPGKVWSADLARAARQRAGQCDVKGVANVRQAGNGVCRLGAFFRRRAKGVDCITAG